MQRMSDMLTRWLDGNLRQSQADDSAETQPDQASGTEQEPVAGQSGAQSDAMVENVSQSDETTESVSEQSALQSDIAVESDTQPNRNEEPVGEQSDACSFSTVEAMPESVQNTDSEMQAFEGSSSVISTKGSRPQGACAIETVLNSDKQIGKTASVQKKDSTLEEGQSGYQEETTDFHLSSPESGKDSSDNKSDESQASFVCKIASMDMDDSDSVKQSNLMAEPVASSGAGQDYTECLEGEARYVEYVPYNPMFPTSYSEQTQDLGREMENQAENLSDNAAFGCVGSKSSSDRNERVLSSNLDDLENISDRTVCDNTVGASDLDSEKTKTSGGRHEHTNHEEPTVAIVSESSQTTDGNIQQAEVTESSTQTGYDTGISIAEEQTVIRQSMEAAVETLRTRNLEPVIHLHYSSEGTSNSTITLGFAMGASFDNLQTTTSDRFTGNPPATSTQSAGTIQNSLAVVNTESLETINTQETPVNLVQTSEGGNNISQCSTSENISRGQNDNRFGITKSERDFDSNVDQSVNNLNRTSETEKEAYLQTEHKFVPNITPERPQASQSVELENSELNVKDTVSDNSTHSECAISENDVKESENIVSCTEELETNEGSLKDTLSHNSKHEPCAISEINNVKVSNEHASYTEESDYTSENMLHTGIIVTAVDDDEEMDNKTSVPDSAGIPMIQGITSTHELSETHVKEKLDARGLDQNEAQLSSVPSVAVTDSHTSELSTAHFSENFEEKRSENQNEGQMSSVPDVSITDSQSSEATSQKPDDVVMEDEESSDFERVLDRVLNTSDESDSQTNTGENRQAPTPMDIDELISQAG